MQPNQGEQNPFLAILAQRRSQGGQQGGMGGETGMPSAMAAQGAIPPEGQPQNGNMIMQPATPPSDQRGQTGDVTKPLVQAASAIHTFLAQSTDKQDVLIGRSIIALLSQLILRDQKKAGENDQRMQAMMSQQNQPTVTQ